MPSVLSVLPVTLAGAQLRHRPLRWLLPVLGIGLAVAATLLAGVLGRVVSAETVSFALGGLVPGERSAVVSFNGTTVDPAQIKVLDDAARTQLATLNPTKAPLRRQLLYREQADDRGGSFFLGAVNDLPSAVRLVEGRLPQTCTPTRCEVVQVGTATAGDVQPTGFFGPLPERGIEVVGVVERTDPLALTGTFSPNPALALYLGGDVDAMAKLADLERFQRTHGWVVPMDLDQVRTEGVNNYLSLVTTATDEVRRVHPGLVLTAPTTALERADERAGVSARRFGLLSSTAAALLLGFVALAGLGQRADQALLHELLSRRGAKPRMIFVVCVWLAVALVAAGVLFGLLVAGLATWMLAAGLSPVALFSSALAALAVPLVWLAVTAVAVLVATLRLPDTSGRTLAITATATAAGAVAAVGLAAARGGAEADSLSGRADPLIPVLPTLAAFVAAVVAALVLLPALGALYRLTPHSRVASRLALLDAIDRPQRPVATAALTAGCVLASAFAWSYQATLSAGTTDQAAQHVPLDVRLTPGPAADNPLTVLDDPQLAELTAAAYPIVRTAGAVRTAASGAEPVTLLGLDPAVLPNIERWAATVGPQDAGEVAAALDTAASPDTSPVIDRDATTVIIPTTGDLFGLEMTLWLQTSRGASVSVPLAVEKGQLAAQLPVRFGDADLVALSVRETPEWATRHQHALNERTTDVEALETVVGLGTPVVAGDQDSAWSWAGWADDGGRAAVIDDELVLDLALLGQQVNVLPGFQGAQGIRNSIPVAVDPATAALARGSELTVTLPDGAPVAGRIVAVLDRFPTTDGRFVIADRDALTSILTANDPGSGGAREAWVSTPDEQGQLVAAAALPPLDRLTVEGRVATEQRAQADPVARGSTRVLVLSGLLGLLLAALAVASLVSGAPRAAYAWESDGVSPATLRRSLWTKAVVVTVIAVPVGAVGGLLLGRAAATLVAVSATGTQPNPPLQLSLSPIAVTLAAAALGTTLVALAAIISARAYREPSAR